MQSIALNAMRILAMVVSLALVSGCPQGETDNVAWLVNGTSSVTYTHFVTGVQPGPVFLKVPLASPLAPGTARRFTFTDEFRGTLTHVGLSTADEGTAFGIVNNGAFGFGGTDFIVDTNARSHWIKEPA